MSDSERSMRDGADPAEGEMSEDDMQAYNDSEYSDFANEEDEEDELVDEIDEAEIQPETNRRSRRAPLRVKLTRRAPAAASSETPRRSSGRQSRRSARARAADSASEEDDELGDSDASETPADTPKTARQIARANRERGIETDELVELPMGAYALTRLTTEETSRRKKLSETELALRRSETARRRRNQSEKKLEDDKIEVRAHVALRLTPDHQPIAQEAGRQGARPGRGH